MIVAANSYNNVPRAKHRLKSIETSKVSCVSSKLFYNNTNTCNTAAQRRRGDVDNGDLDWRPSASLPVSTASYKLLPLSH